MFLCEEQWLMHIAHLLNVSENRTRVNCMYCTTYVLQPSQDSEYTADRYIFG